MQGGDMEAPPRQVPPLATRRSATSFPPAVRSKAAAPCDAQLCQRVATHRARDAGCWPPRISQGERELDGRVRASPRPVSLHSILLVYAIRARRGQTNPCMPAPAAKQSILTLGTLRYDTALYSARGSARAGIAEHAAGGGRGRGGDIISRLPASGVGAQYGVRWSPTATGRAVCAALLCAD